MSLGRILADWWREVIMGEGNVLFPIWPVRTYLFDLTD